MQLCKPDPAHLLHQRLHENPTAEIENTLQQLVTQQRRRNLLLSVIIALLLLEFVWINFG